MEFHDAPFLRGCRASPRIYSMFAYNFGQFFENPYRQRERKTVDLSRDYKFHYRTSYSGLLLKLLNKTQIWLN